MDKSKTYIEMCKKATELSSLKWEYGFIDGDWLYLGENGVRVLGFDSICISQSVEDDNGNKKAKIEIVHTDNITIDTNERDIDINILEYPVDSYINPIWLPRQDQLESFFYQAILEKINLNSWITILNDYYNISNKIKEYASSMERLALIVIMEKKFNLIWSGNNWINGSYVKINA